jgi:hypothetical protein
MVLKYMNKINHWNLTSTYGASLAWNFTLSRSPSALEALKVAQATVILENLKYIYGRRNSFSLLPNTWDIKLCDTLLSKTSHLVTVSNSSVLQIREDSNSKVDCDLFIDSLDVRIDSDAALARLRKISELDQCEVSSIEYLLQKNLTISDVPLWSLRLFQYHNGNEKEFGKVWISARKGEIMDLDIRPISKN